MPRTKVPSSLGDVKFDAIINRDRTLSADVPEYPVESGFPVCDAVLRKPLELSITAFISNTPVTWKSQIGNTRNRVGRVVKQLENMYFAGEPLTFVSGNKVYRNMAITSISLSETAEMMNAIEVPITLKQIEVTQAKTTTIPSSYGMSGATGESGGSASTEEKTDESTNEKASSILFGLTN